MLIRNNIFLKISNISEFLQRNRAKDKKKIHRNIWNAAALFKKFIFYKFDKKKTFRMIYFVS